MAKFIVTMAGNEHPATTCDVCKGLGYLTEPCTFESRKVIGDEWHVHRAESGDPCPMCVGRGWTIVADGKWRDLSKLKHQL